MGMKKIHTSAISGLQIGKSGDKLGFYGATPVVRPAAYTITNDSADRTLDADGTNVPALADTVATLIKDLISLGILQ